MRTTFAPSIAGILFIIVSGTAACSDDDTSPGPGAGGSAGTSDAAGAAGTADTDAGTGGSAGTVDEAGSDVAITDSGEATITTSTGTWVVYPDPYGDGGAANPIAATVMGTAQAFALPGGKMRLTLSVTGLPPNRTFGSHLHKLACDNNKAGGHYQNMGFPEGGSANDPTFANGSNEVWLDFTTDANGAGSSETTVDFRPRAGEANAIMIHDMKTGDGGVAGAKLACTNMPF